MNMDEFQCKCGKCSRVNPDPFLRYVINLLEVFYERDAHITSGYRCPSYNSTIKGAAPNSYHVKRMAIDFVIPGWDNERVYHVLDKGWPDTNGVRLYRGHIHFDVREKPHRWRFDQSG